MFKFIQLFVAALISTSAVANETVIKINNPLSKEKVEKQVNQNVAIFLELEKDLYEQGVIFKFSGTKTYPINNNFYFQITNLTVNINKKLIEKYSKYPNVLESQTFFIASLEEFGGQPYFVNASSMPNPIWGTSRYIFVMDLLDKNGESIYNRRIPSLGLGPQNFFSAVNDYKKNGVLKDIDITYGGSRDYSIPLDLDVIEKIDSVRFKVQPNPKFK